jgi:hypothetical protein
MVCLIMAATCLYLVGEVEVAVDDEGVVCLKVEARQRQTTVEDLVQRRLLRTGGLVQWDKICHKKNEIKYEKYC